MKIHEKLAGANTSNTAFVFDFDATMIHKYVGDHEVPSIISILRSDGHLGEEYSKEAYGLKDKYHPIEIDNSKTHEEKLEAAESWWQEHGEVLIRYGLSLSALEKAVKNEKLLLRKGFENLLRFSAEKNIPLFIFSASGIGRDSIEKFLKYKNFDTTQVHIISNSFIWDSTGTAIKRIEPVIHGMNKNEEALESFPIERDLLYSKDFVILAGDSLEDPKMASEKHHKSIYRIGFCCIKEENKKKEMLPIYNKIYDIVLDGESELTEESNTITGLL